MILCNSTCATGKVCWQRSAYIRFVLLEDPNNYVSINKETGTLTSVKKMDRESPLLNGTGIYNILIGAIDNGSRD